MAHTFLNLKKASLGWLLVICFGWVGHAPAQDFSEAIRKFATGGGRSFPEVADAERLVKETSAWRLSVHCDACQGQANPPVVCDPHQEQAVQSIARYWSGLATPDELADQEADAEALEDEDSDEDSEDEDLEDEDFDDEGLDDEESTETDESSAQLAEGEMTEMQKAMLVLDIAKNCEAHSNAPSREVLEFLERILSEDHPWQSRAAAVSALSHYPDPAQSLPILEPFLRGIHKDRMLQRAALRKQGSQLNQGLDVSEWGGGQGVITGADMQRFQQAIRDWNAMRPELRAYARILNQWQLAVSGVGQIKAERCSGLLVALAQDIQEEPLPDFFVDALLFHPTLARVQTAVAGFATMDQRIKDMDKLIHKTKKMRPTRKPRGVDANSSLWKEAFERVKNMRIDNIEAAKGEVYEDLRDLSIRVGDWGAKRGLPKPKIKSRRYTKPWRGWMNRHKRSFPKSLQIPAEVISGKTK